MTDSVYRFILKSLLRIEKKVDVLLDAQNSATGRIDHKKQTCPLCKGEVQYLTCMVGNTPEIIRECKCQVQPTQLADLVPRR